MSQLLRRSVYYLKHGETPEKTLRNSREKVFKMISKESCKDQPGMFWDTEKQECRELPKLGTQRIIRPDEMERIKYQTFTIQSGSGVIPKLKKGGLYGYKTKDKKEDRLKSLKRAVKKDGFSTISKRMTAIATLLKNTNPKVSQIIKRDRVSLKKFTSKSTTRK